MFNRIDTLRPSGEAGATGVKAGVVVAEKTLDKTVFIVVPVGIVSGVNSGAPPVIFPLAIALLDTSYKPIVALSVVLS